VYLTDSTRHSVDLPNARPITVQLWYPSSHSGPLARYLFENALPASMLRNDYYGIDSTALRTWATITTHSHVDAPPVAGKHALIAFSVGLGVARANYTSVAEELASHGLIVALVESPLQGFMVLPNGREVMDTAGRFGDIAAHRRGVTDWAKDISFAFDALQRGRVSAAATRVAATIDWSRVGATGHSSGGLGAAQACADDARVRACVDLDGGLSSPDGEPMAEFEKRPVTKPLLIFRSKPLYDDTTFARRHTTREQWEKQGAAGTKALADFANRSKETVRVARLAGAGHFNFSDAPFVFPTAITRFGGRIIDGQRGWLIITTVLRTYFENEFAGKGDGLAPLRSRFLELEVD
jgi:dienelactone hydrolase